MADSDSYDSSSSSSDSCYDSSPRRRSRSSNKPRNIFKNDGNFLKMFQLLQQEGKTETDTPAVQTPPAEPSPPASSISPPPLQSSSQTSSHTNPANKDPTKKKSLMSFVGKRRGGKVLPTGIVKKQRKDNPIKEGNPKDAWSQYMEEVRKYKELSCEEEGKTRPLVK